MEPIRKKILLTYGISIAVTTILMIWLLVGGEQSLAWTTLFLFSATKFISGFGLMLTLTTASIFVLTKFSDKFKGNKRNLDIFNWFLLVIVPIVLLVYNFYKIFDTFNKGASTDGVFDNLIFIYGIVSLLISLYIKPTLNETLMDAADTTTGDKAKHVVKDLGRGIKKRWFTWRKDYAKATVQDALTLKEEGELLKQRVAIIMLPAIGLGTLTFTPIMAVCVLFFIQLLKDANSIKKTERIALIVAIIGVAVISALLPFVVELTNFYLQAKAYWWILSLVYFLALLLSTFLFIKKLLNMQGYTIEKLIQKRKTAKKEKLGENKDALKAREKDLKAKEKGLKKQEKELGSKNTD